MVPLMVTVFKPVNRSVKHLSIVGVAVLIVLVAAKAALGGC